MIEFTGARPIPVPIREENNFAFSADETLKLITPKTRLLILNSPANPTGGVTPKAEIDKLVAGLEKFPDVAVMSDEIYDQMTYDGEEHVTLLNYPSIRDRLILLNGWSKTYAMTGWRLGYSVWPESSTTSRASSRSIPIPASMRRHSSRGSPPSPARRTT
jgi:aspartate aminotransferase